MSKPKQSKRLRRDHDGGAIAVLEAERDAALRRAQQLEWENALYATGTALLNALSDQGAARLLRDNAQANLAAGGPRRARLGMLEDLCRWDIGGRANAAAMSRLAATPDNEVTVQFVDGVFAQLSRLTCDAAGGAAP